MPFQEIIEAFCISCSVSPSGKILQHHSSHHNLDISTEGRHLHRCCPVRATLTLPSCPMFSFGFNIIFFFSIISLRVITLKFMCLFQRSILENSKAYITRFHSQVELTVTQSLKSRVLLRFTKSKLFSFMKQTRDQWKKYLISYCLKIYLG